jgi:hypothetical protein
MGEQVTDPALLAQLNAPGPAAPTQVTDPALLAQLNAPGGESQAPAQPTSLADIGRNFLSAAMRPVLNAVGGIPEMAANAGVGLRNLSEGGVNKLMPKFADAIYAANRHLAGDSEMLAALLPQGPPAGNYGSFSSEYRPQIDATFAPPQGIPGTAAEFASTALLGGAMPSPQAAQQAPADFVRAVTSPKQVALDASQGAGYVVPPATTNPSVTNKVLESIGGKTGLAQDARAVNEGVTNKLAAKALGLEEDTAITPELLKGIRAQAAAPNRAIRQTGTIDTDAAFKTGVDEVLAKFKSAGGVSDKLAQTEVKDIAESFKKSFPASDAVDAVQVLRDRASAAYAKGDSETGKGLRALSKVLEDQIERHLEGLGKDGADLLARFRDGRQLMAKTFSVESALNPQTGAVSAAKLASQLAKGKPLSGPLLTAAKFGQAFPKVAQPLTDSGSVRNTDVALGGLAAVMDKSTWPLIYPFARLGARAGLLSPAGQKLATASQGGIPPGLLMGSQAGAEDLLGQ